MVVSGLPLSRISGNLEMSGNSAEVKGKGTKSGKGQGICAVGDI